MLQEKELKILDLLAEATKEYTNLSDHRPSDMGEWIRDVHNLQNRVMARSAIRAHEDHPSMMSRVSRRA